MECFKVSCAGHVFRLRVLTYVRRVFRVELCVLFADGRFDLPEERTIVNLLVGRGYAVLAPASKNRESG